MRPPLLAVALAACSGTGATPEAPVAAPVRFEALDAARLVTRASLDLRGIRPDEAELDAVLAYPDLIDVLVDDFLADDRLEARTREIFAETYRTRTDAYIVDVYGFDVTEAQRARLQHDAGDEPLRVLGRIAVEDRPVSEVVTADWSMANKVLAEVLPVDYPASESGWEVVRYQDGRPAAGVLSTTGMWWRYQTTDSNANRKRANAISRILLCDDYLDRPVDFDRSEGLLETDFEERTMSDPSCASCHVTLDPIASYLYGFSWFAFGGDDVTRYHPSRERMWQERTGVAPAWYGEPGSSLGDLGRQIAADPRFEACLARQLTEALVGRAAASSEVDEHTEALQDGGHTFRGALRSVVASPAYRATTDDGVEGGANPAKLAAPALMQSQVEALTGFVWEEDGVELMTSDLLGFLSLAGGADGYTVTERATEPGPTLVLVQERLAERAAEHAVERTLAEPGSVALVDRLELDWRPATDRVSMSEQLALAQRRALGREASSAELDDLLELWTELLAVESDPARAWVGTLSVFLRDPDFLLY